MIEVVTVYSPRPSHEKYLDFLPLLRLQKATAEHFGHRHLVVSDAALPGFNVQHAELPSALMLAILAGQIAYLEQWPGTHPVLLADADVLVARALESAFGAFHLGLTNRDDPRCPINNGAMYVGPGNKSAVLDFLRRALDTCGKHWGGDQEAISATAAPVPNGHGIEDRGGFRIAFLSMRSHNVIPREPGLLHKSNPFVVHFKGVERKPWMEQYARSFILKEKGTSASATR